jgi:hypothetical protein
LLKATEKRGNAGVETSPHVLSSNPVLGTTMDFWHKPRTLSFSLSEEFHAKFFDGLIYVRITFHDMSESWPHKVLVRSDCKSCFVKCAFSTKKEGM